MSERCLPCRARHAKCRHARGSEHLVISDVQAKPGVDLSHLSDIGKYIRDRRPSVVVIIGDFADMKSLSLYDVGKRKAEGQRYSEDIKAARTAMRLLMEPWHNIKGYKPRQILTLGNHENRITRAANDDPKLHGTISVDDLEYEKWGWEVFPFLQQVVVDGIMYIHYLPTGKMANACGSAAALLTKGKMSVTVGHAQPTDIAFATRADGQRLIGLMAGCTYTHDEDYIPPLMNQVPRQIIYKHEVDGKGSYDPMFVSLAYLKARYAA